jgi:hypothetical protein
MIVWKTWSLMCSHRKVHGFKRGVYRLLDLLSADYEANRWIHHVTLQVLAASVNHMSSRLRRLIVEGVTNGHGNELRKIASFCMSLERKQSVAVLMAAVVTLRNKITVMNDFILLHLLENV